jgi:hypothetical protein
MTVAPVVFSALALLFPHPGKVTCHLLPDADRSLFGESDGSQVWVRPEICAEANSVFRTRTLTDSGVWAISVLAHEQEHVRQPGASEAQVQCRAIQDTAPLTFAALGGYGPDAWIDRLLARGAREQVRTMTRRILPREYQSACTEAPTR